MQITVVARLNLCERTITPGGARRLLRVQCAGSQGSRNGHAPIYMWYTLTRKGYEGMRKDVQKCLRNAHLLKVRRPSGNVI